MYYPYRLGRMEGRSLIMVCIDGRSADVGFRIDNIGLLKAERDRQGTRHFSEGEEGSEYLINSFMRPP